MEIFNPNFDVLEKNKGNTERYAQVRPVRRKRGIISKGL